MYCSIVIQMFLIWSSLIVCTYITPNVYGQPMVNVPNVPPVPNKSVSTPPIHTNTIQRLIKILENKSVSDESRGLKRVYLSDRHITCNDGSRAGFYLRKYHGSKKWIIFLEGGWYCYDHKSCRNRWMRLRHLMTSTQWPESRDIGGLLSSNPEENPYWWNANHVFIPYCTSDAWSGTQAVAEDKFNFMGAKILEQTIRDLLPLGLQNATQMLLGGSSAGGTGAMVNLDTVRDLLHHTLNLKHIEVRGVIDSGWFLDRAPYAPGLATVEAIRKGMKLWMGKVPKKCQNIYKDEPWRCYFGYRLYPTLKSPLFVFQWLFDEAQMSADNVGAPVTKQQWDYIHKMGDSLRHSFENVTALFAPSCISHSVLTKRDWLNVKVDDISVAEALHCWERHLDSINNNTSVKNSIQHDEDLTMNKIAVDLDTNEPTNFPSIVSIRHRIIPTLSTIRDSMLKNNMDAAGEKPVPKRRRRKKHRNKNNRRNHQNKKRKGRKQRAEKEKKMNQLSPEETNLARRPERSLLKAKKRSKPSSSHHQSILQQCKMRVMERCSWPQCNHSCPKLHNPYTGEELDFIELLKSFGLDMDSVALALGIDVNTLNNMDHSELLNLLTQSAS